jgi:hypothetical protein
MDRRTRIVWIGLCPKCHERILRPELEQEKLKSVSMVCECGILVACQRVAFTGEALTPPPRPYHHVWCNGRPDSPVLGCRWCLHENKEGEWTGLWIDYPYDPAMTTGTQLMKTYFPQNIART